MNNIGVALIVVGIIGLALSTMMFGDIGVAAVIGSLASLFSGIGFILANKKFNQISKA